MADDPKQKAQDLVDRLREGGHHAEADQLARQIKVQAVERGLLFGVREVCETLLTALEAIDPVTQTMIEELRLEVEKRLRLHDDRPRATDNLRRCQARRTRSPTRSHGSD